VTLTQPGRTPIEWSFVVAPPWQRMAGYSLVLHVAASSSKTVMGNLTEPFASGYTTAYPCLQGRPTASARACTEDPDTR
jgi:hypothetical protein